MLDKIKVAFVYVPDGIVRNIKEELELEGVELIVLNDEAIENLDKIAGYNLLIVDFSGNREEASKLVRRIRGASKFARILILVQVDQLYILENEYGYYDDYLNKPFKPHHLLYKIKLNLRLLRLLEGGISKTDQFELLSEIANKLARADNFYDTVHLVAKRIAKYLGVMRCSIIVVPDDEKEFIMISTSDNDRLFKMPLKLDKYPEIKEIIKTRRPFEISDVENSFILKEFNRELKEAGIRYICLIPINDINEFLGVIFIRDNRERHLSAIELDFMTLVGEIIGIFFNNSKFLNEMKSISRDMASEIKSMEFTLSKLREDRDFLNDLIQDAIEGIIITNIDGNILVFNKTTEKVLGYSSVEVVEKMRIQDLLPQDYSEDIIEEFNNKRFGSRAIVSMGKKLLIGKKKESIPVMLNAKLIGKSKDFLGIIWQFVDMRELINAQEKLVELTENLEIARKKAFTAALAGTAAHEMNQPLQSIMGYVELLMRRVKEGTLEHKYLTTINQECERMAQIIKNIGNITRYKTKEYVGSARIIDINEGGEDKE
ncbi:MAG: PAS domain S-box protein [Deltaproteobacteria bacterium]|nr:PAS domain S-box protein [Deltaproteobacteria bacterium]